jgi:GT2 family glycosyltransferase
MTVPSGVTIAIVSFNTREVLLDCVESALGAHPDRVVVVDNASTDGSATAVRERFPAVLVIENPVNIGYGAAANRAVEACATPIVLLLNSDTLVAPDAATSMGAYLAQHDRVAVAGPRLTNVDGSLQPSTFPFPSVRDVVVAETGLHVVLRHMPLVRERLLRTWSHDRARPVPWVKGAAIAIRRDAFESVGGFDEGYFMYSEEVDLSRRLAGSGFETHFAPVTTVIHRGGHSTARVIGAMNRERLVSGRRYLVRHEPRRAAQLVLFTLHQVFRVRAVRDAILAMVARDANDREQRRSSAAANRQLACDGTLWRV